MSQYFHIHPDNPQTRLLKQAVAIIRNGGVVAYPTDSAYALGCHLGDKDALQRIIRLRQLDERHQFTLLCRDLSEIATYAKVNNATYRLLKAHTPGAYTFILTASSEVPKRLMHPKRKTIGLRVPEHPICLGLLAELNEPLLTMTSFWTSTRRTWPSWTNSTATALLPSKTIRLVRAFTSTRTLGRSSIGSI